MTPGASSGATSGWDALDLLPLGVLVGRDDGHADVANRAWVERSGQYDGAWRGRGWLDVVAAAHRAERRGEMVDGLRGRGSYEAEWALSVGSRRVLVAATVLGDDPGRWLATFTDLLPAVAAVGASHVDPLTGLIDRNAFLERLRGAVGQSPGSASMATLLIVDPDRLQETNDRLGRAAGDRRLVHIAECVATAAGGDALVARGVDDELLVLRSFALPHEEAPVLAQQIHDAIRPPLPTTDRVSVSIGVAIAHDPEVGAEQVLRDADLALRRAKRAALPTHILTSRFRRGPRASVDGEDAGLAAVLAHQLRTPVTVVVGMAEVLALHHEEMSIDEVDSSLTALHRQSRRLVRVVDGVLQLVRPTGAEPSRRPTTVLAEAIDGALEDAPPPRWVTVATPGDANARVEGDHLRLSGVIANLLTNAYRYGGPRVVIGVHPADPAHVVVSVTDDGPGVPPGDEAMLFAPFVRGTGSSELQPDGSGLGLAIARRAVEEMGGSLDYSPAAATGSRFSITLRRAPTLVPDEALLPPPTG